jgi:hypothetical protein
MLVLWSIARKFSSSEHPTDDVLGQVVVMVHDRVTLSSSGSLT